MGLHQCATRPFFCALMFVLVPVTRSQDTSSRRDRKIAPARWWCDKSRGHSGSMFCKTALLKEAIMMAEDTAGKQARVDELRAAVLKGDAEAEGMDATNPERQRMMEAWCASDDPVRSDPKSDIDCAKSKAKSDFLKRREVRRILPRSHWQLHLSASICSYSPPHHTPTHTSMKVEHSRRSGKH